MASLEEFLTTGHLGPLNVGISPNDVMAILGEPDGISRKSNPLLFKYGMVELLFLRIKKEYKHELREMVLDYQGGSEPPPACLKFTDWDSVEPPTERRFRDFLHRIAYPPRHRGEGASWSEWIFPSGVTARFKDEMLQSLRLSERESQSAQPFGLTDEREPTFEQILEMFDEADVAVQAGAKRAALLIAWAGLEASFRRAAVPAGRNGNVGTQPVVLLRELVSEGFLTSHEHRLLEHFRQLRMSAAHGLTPVPFSSELISQARLIASQLLGAGAVASRP
jgi:hypothetical protein